MFFLFAFPAKRDEMFLWEKVIPPRRDTGFMNVGSVLGGQGIF